MPGFFEGFPLFLMIDNQKDLFHIVHFIWSIWYGPLLMDQKLWFILYGDFYLVHLMVYFGFLTSEFFPFSYKKIIWTISYGLYDMNHMIWCISNSIFIRYAISFNCIHTTHRQKLIKSGIKGTFCLEMVILKVNDLYYRFFSCATQIHHFDIYLRGKVRWNFIIWLFKKTTWLMTLILKTLTDMKNTET